MWRVCWAEGASLGAHGRASVWRCGDVTLDLGRTRVMGVVNATPDSFSDGGAHAGAREAVAWGLKLLDDGADVLDVGGESTRPGFSPVEVGEELARVVPVVRELAQAGALVSVDTRHAAVAEAALEAGAKIVNDVSGFTDPAMLALAARCDCGCVAMHAGPGSLGGPAPDAARLPADEADFVEYLERYLLGRAVELEAVGVAPERICLDPGAGFGTTPVQDVAAQRATARLADLGYPLACAVSRKRFVGAVSGVKAAGARDAATVGTVLAAAAAGARVVRVHDVASAAEALRAAEACAAGFAPARRAFVALGANMGDRVEAMRTAAAAVGALPLTRVLGASRVYETEPAYLDDQPAFANAVLEVESGLHPIALLEALLGIEDAAGRVRTVANGPRCLDLDLLWMEGERHAGRRLRLPHPLMGERSFVLRPLGDLVGDAAAVCRAAGLRVANDDELVGTVTGDLGELLP